MKHFDPRWTELVERSRSESAADSPQDSCPPAGFATRVMAKAAEAGAFSHPEIDWEAHWLRRARQSLAVAFTVAVVLVGLDLRQRTRPALRHPGIENTVAQLLWKL